MKGEDRTSAAGQGAAILSAAESLVVRRGAHALTIEAVCEAAAVPRDAFRSLFADRDQLMLMLFDDLSTGIADRMRRAYRGEGTWLDGVRAATFSLLCHLEAEPSIARFLIVESMRDECMLSRRSELMMSAAQALQADSPAAAAGEPPAPFGSEAVVGTVVSVLHGRLLEDPVPPLRSLTGSLMALIVLPFLGASASREELSRLVADAA